MAVIGQQDSSTHLTTLIEILRDSWIIGVSEMLRQGEISRDGVTIEWPLVILGPFTLGHGRLGELKYYN